MELVTRKLVAVEKGLQCSVRYLIWPIMEPRELFLFLCDDPLIINQTMYICSFIQYVFAVLLQCTSHCLKFLYLSVSKRDNNPSLYLSISFNHILIPLENFSIRGRISIGLVRYTFSVAWMNQDWLLLAKSCPLTFFPKLLISIV